MDKISASWRATFDNNPTYASSAGWNLFTNLWRQTQPVKQSDAAAFVIELRSASGSKTFVDQAIKDELIQVVSDAEGDDRTRYIQLSQALRRELDRFFDDAVDFVLKTNEHFKDIDSQDS